MDELAEKLGMDPLELRYKNVYREGSTTPTGQKPEVHSLPEMLDILRPRYLEAGEKARAASTDQVKRGVGISIGVYGCGLDGPDSSEVRMGVEPGRQRDPLQHMGGSRPGCGHGLSGYGPRGPAAPGPEAPSRFTWS